ncbi:hypothetical protein SAMN05216316_2354 [Nitrosovibrio sp. Nv6]|nr:hypothetical protein SAMN05216316_2354 [Nitrosovibrio sp. Nv6]
MKTKSGTFVGILAMLGLLASCAQMGPMEAQNDNIRTAATNARTYADHDKLVKQYQRTAKEMLVKAEEQKKLLQHYEEKSYLYGRQAQDKQSHTLALLHKYERTAEETMKQAAFHQKMALELAERGDTASAEIPSGRNLKNNARVGSDSNDQI